MTRDAFAALIEEALTLIPPDFRDAMRNFLRFTSVSGFTPRTLSPEKFWDFPDLMKPFLAQGCLLASRALGDFTWIGERDYRSICAYLDYWDANRRGGHGLYMWRSSLESGVDNNATTVNQPDFYAESVDVNAYLVRELLGIESGRESSEARRWREAAAERWDSARATGAASVVAVKNFGGEARDQARTLKDNLSNRITERKLRRSEDDDQHDDRS